MKKLLSICLLTLSLGCTSAQLQQAETDVHKAVVLAQKVIATYEDNQATLAEVEAALTVLNALAPKTGNLHQAIVDAQNAIQALKNNQGTIDMVKKALAQVEAATAPATPK